uniref:Uncharacterized protein n=1 Tax=Loxodonta africana TaxID=9785 RepID=G3UC87_LOXAF
EPGRRKWFAISCIVTTCLSVEAFVLPEDNSGRVSPSCHAENPFPFIK